MNYIRTTKGIWEIEKLTKEDYVWLQIGRNNQADTIEELCDEYVMIDKENEHYINQLNDIHHIRRKWATGNYEVYGAIWTEWGLKYVAKMNDKGELELI